MLEDIRNHWNDYEIVLFKEISRLSRDRINVENMFQIFKNANIQMVSATQPIDTTTPIGRFLFNILCDVAQFESDWISQRTKDGLQERRKIGLGKRGPDKKPRKAKMTNPALTGGGHQERHGSGE